MHLRSFRLVLPSRTSQFTPYRYLHSTSRRSVSAPLFVSDREFLLSLRHHPLISASLLSEINSQLALVHPSPTLQEFGAILQDLQAENDVKAALLARTNEAKAASLAAVNEAEFTSLWELIASLQVSRDASEVLHLEVTLPQALATVFRIFRNCSIRALEILYFQDADREAEARMMKMERFESFTAEGKEQGRRVASGKVLEQGRAVTDTMSPLEFLEMASTPNYVSPPFHEWAVEIQDGLVQAQVLSFETALLLEYLVKSFPESEDDEPFHIKSFGTCLRILHLYRQAKIKDPDLVIHHELKLFEQMARILGGEKWQSLSPGDPLCAVCLSSAMTPELSQAARDAAVQEEV